MAVITDVPSGAGSVSAWTGSWTDLVADDGDTTNINSDGISAEHKWAYPTLPVGLLSPAVSASYAVKARLTGGTPTIAVFDGVAYGAQEALTGSYEVHTVAAAALAIASLNGYEGGVQRGAMGAGNNVNASYATRVVTANYASGFVFDFCSWLVPLMGTAVDLATFQRATARIRQGSRLTRLTSEERVRLFREWQGYRHPVYV